jgi:Flp pilus assembly protein TadD
MDFRKGTEALPTEVIQSLLNAYTQMGQTNQSIDFFYALARFYLKLGQDANALRTLEQLSTMEPEDGQIHYDLGTMYFRTGEMDKAQKELSTAVIQLVGPNAKIFKAKAYNLLGQLHYQTGNMEGAHYNWTKALAFDPQNADIKINLAIAQLKRGQVAAALNDLTKALEKNPDSPKILSNMGLAAYMSKKPLEAVAYYEKGLRALEKKMAK